MVTIASGAFMTGGVVAGTGVQILGGITPQQQPEQLLRLEL